MDQTFMEDLHNALKSGTPADISYIMIMYPKCVFQFLSNIFRCNDGTKEIFEEQDDKKLFDKKFNLYAEISSAAISLCMFVDNVRTFEKVKEKLEKDIKELIVKKESNSKLNNLLLQKIEEQKRIIKGMRAEVVSLDDSIIKLKEQEADLTKYVKGIVESQEEIKEFKENLDMKELQLDEDKVLLAEKFYSMEKMILGINEQKEQIKRSEEDFEMKVKMQKERDATNTLEIQRVSESIKKAKEENSKELEKVKNEKKEIERLRSKLKTESLSFEKKEKDLTSTFEEKEKEFQKELNKKEEKFLDELRKKELSLDLKIKLREEESIKKLQKKEKDNDLIIENKKKEVEEKLLKDKEFGKIEISKEKKKFEILIKNYETKQKEYETKLKEGDIKQKEYETKLKDIELIQKECEIKKKDINEAHCKLSEDMSRRMYDFDQQIAIKNSEFSSYLMQKEVEHNQKLENQKEVMLDSWKKELEYLMTKIDKVKPFVKNQKEYKSKTKENEDSSVSKEKISGSQ